MSWPTAIDLFAGIGGLSLGLRRAQFRVVGAVEFDELSSESYAANFPSVQLWQEDIRSLDPAALLSELGLSLGELDVLAGCPPCQGFSAIRTRRGRTARDTRNALILEMARFAEVMAPRAVLMENVPGVATYRQFKHLVARLRALGYQVQWRVSDAADFGVPQRRRRLILLAMREGFARFGEHQDNRRTVRDAIEHLPDPGSTGDPLHDVVERRSDRVIEMISKIPVDGGSRVALGDLGQLECHRRTNGFRDVYGRMSWDSVAPTITGGCVSPSKGRFLHPELDRAITPREALLLQSFPPDYRVSLRRGKYRAAEMIGNAIPPPLVAAHARPLRCQLQGG